jgi:ABC-type Fe3+ transport system substrate-binding protein
MRLGARYSAVAGLISICLASPSVFAASAVDIGDWPAVMAKAKQEGVVVVKGAPGTNYRAALVTAFNAAHPDIKVQFSGGAGAAEIPKVIRERQAGIYAWDVWIGGPTGALGQLKDTGFFQPLESILRPEVKADDKWTGGFAAGWMDNDQTIFYAFDGTVQQTIQVNWDVVPRDSLRTLPDLLKPEFAGKIVWLDPRQTGTGNGTSQTILGNLGMDGLIALYKHNVVYTKNPQQIGEWVVRGRYPIGIGLEAQTLDSFQSQGVGTNVSPLPDDAYKMQQISVGFGGVGLVDRAPNIHAATVYINWLLSQAGQEAWPRNSRRTDVAGAFPDYKPKPGKEYVIGQAEKFTEQRLQLLKVAQEAIDGAAPKPAR